MTPGVVGAMTPSVMYATAPGSAGQYYTQYWFVNAHKSPPSHSLTNLFANQLKQPCVEMSGAWNVCSYRCTLMYIARAFNAVRPMSGQSPMMPMFSPLGSQPTSLRTSPVNDGSKSGTKVGADPNDAGAGVGAGAGAVDSKSPPQQVFFPTYPVAGAGTGAASDSSNNGAGGLLGGGGAATMSLALGDGAAGMGSIGSGSNAAASTAGSVPFNDMDGLEAELRIASNQ